MTVRKGGLLFGTTSTYPYDCPKGGSAVRRTSTVLIRIHMPSIYKREFSVELRRQYSALRAFSVFRRLRRQILARCARIKRRAVTALRALSYEHEKSAKIFQLDEVGSSEKWSSSVTSPPLTTGIPSNGF
jgi:hypothetical protein